MTLIKILVVIVFIFLLAAVPGLQSLHLPGLIGGILLYVWVIMPWQFKRYRR